MAVPTGLQAVIQKRDASNEVEYASHLPIVAINHEYK